MLEWKEVMTNIHWLATIGSYEVDVFSQDTDEGTKFYGAICYAFSGNSQLICETSRDNEKGILFESLGEAQKETERKLREILLKQLFDLSKVKDVEDLDIESFGPIKDAKIENLKINITVEIEGRKWSWTNNEESWLPAIMTAIRNEKDPTQAIEFLTDLGDRLSNNPVAKGYEIIYNQKIGKIQVEG